MKLLLIDSRIKYGALVSARKADVDYIIFDYYADTIDSILSNIYDKGIVYSDIALVQDGPAGAIYGIVDSAKSGVGDTDEGAFSWLYDFLSGLQWVQVKNFDILACGLYSIGNIPAIFLKLEAETGVHLRASTTPTGNPRYGGNWMMESDGTDIRETYFTDEIEEFDELLYLAWWGDNQYYGDNRIVGSVSSVGAIVGGRIWAWGSQFSGGTGYNELFADIPANIEYTDISAIYATTSSMAAVDTSGYIWAWGSNSTGGIGAGINAAKKSNVITNGPVVGGENAFATIDTTGRIWAWGNTSFGGTGLNAVDISSPNGLGGITFIQGSLRSNAFAFAARDISNRIWAWGSITQGGAGANTRTAAIPTGLAARTFTGPIYSNVYAFASIDTTGRVWAWGSTTQGGGSATSAITAATPSTMTAVICIQGSLRSTQSAFAVISNTNRVYAWGAIGDGGIGGSSISGGIPGNMAAILVNSVYSTAQAFAALDSSGIIWCWGNTGAGGVAAATSATTPTNLTTIRIQSGKIVSNTNAFAALDFSGRVWAWGSPFFGGHATDVAAAYIPANMPSNIVSLYANSVSFAALDSSGRVWTWGTAGNGAVHPNPQTAATPINMESIIITKIYANSSTYFAVDTSNNIWSWGSTSSGGAGNIVLQIPTNYITTGGAQETFAVGTSYTGIFDNTNNLSYWGFGTNYASNTYTAVNSSSFALNGIYDASHIYPIAPSTPALNRVYGASYKNSSVCVLLDKNQKVWCWGALTRGGISEKTASIPINLENIRIAPNKIFSNRNAQAVIDISGRVWCWGDTASGGMNLTNATTPNGLTSAIITNVYGTSPTSSAAFAALDTSKRIWCWGSSANGGVTSTTTASTPTNMTTIQIDSNNVVGNNSAFAAVDVSGRVWAWGAAANGGINATAGTTPTNLTTVVIQKVFNNSTSFAALDTSGRIWCWGATANGGVTSTTAANTPTNLTSIIIQPDKVYPCTAAYAVIDSSNRVWTWGSGIEGGTAATATTPTGLETTQIQYICAANVAYAALDFSGRIWCWGDTLNGGVGGRTASTPLGLEIIQIQAQNIYSTSSVFAAITNSGQIYVWGSPITGGISGGQASIPTNLNGINITKVAAGVDGVYALDSNGRVWSWGLPTSGFGSSTVATIPTNISGIVLTNTLQNTVRARDIFGGSNVCKILDIYDNIWSFGDLSFGGTGANTTTASNPLGFYGNSPITSIKTNQTSAVYLDTSGYVYSLGSTLSGSLLFAQPHRLHLGNIVSLEAVDDAFSAVDGSGSVWSWGSPTYGSVANSTHINPSQPRSGASTIIAKDNLIFSTRNYFFIVDSALNRIWGWGKSLAGTVQTIGLLGPTTPRFSTTIISNSYAFAMLDLSGKVWVYGETFNGGGSIVSASQPTNLTTPIITQMQSTIAAFAVLDTTGRIWSWGDSGYGGSLLGGVTATTPTNISGITISGQIYATQSAFTVRDLSGRIWAWGNTGEGGCGANGYTAGLVQNLSGVAVDWSRVYSTATAFAVIDTSGQIWTWGSLTGGGCGTATNIAAIPTNLRGVQIQNVYFAAYGFAVTDFNDQLYFIGSEYTPNKVNSRAYTPPELVGKRVQRVFGSSSGDFNKNQYNTVFTVQDTSNNVYIYGSDLTSQLVNKRTTAGKIVSGFTNNIAPAIATSLTYNMPSSNSFLMQDLITLIGTDFSDVNISDIKSAVIIGQTTANGIWKYSPNDIVYYDVPTFVSSTAGVLVKPTTYLKFFPTSGAFTGTVSLTMKCYDSTPMYYNNDLSGLGDIINTSYLTTGSFSANSFTASMLYAPVNTPPALTSGTYTLYTTYEDVTDVSNTGVLIGSFITSLGGAYSDIDPGANKGVAIYAIDNTYGKWQYRLSGDASFQDISTAVGPSNSLLLNEAARIRFAPNLNQSNDLYICSFKAWDQTAGTVGQYANSAFTATGAFSSGTAFGVVNVLPINDPPVLVSGTYSFFSISEDIVDASNSGRTVRQLLDIVSGNYTDVDSALRGIAVIGAITTNGSWQYRLDGSATFTTFGTIAEVSGLLLDPSATVRFVPNAHYNGTTAMTFKAWDQTVGAAGQTVNTTYTASGGAFSLASAQAQVIIDAVNDPPQITAGTSITLQTIPFNISDVSNTGITVQQVITLLGANYTDVDTDASQGIAIIGYSQAVANLEYNVSGTWIVAPALSTVSGLLLTPSCSIRARSMTAAGRFTVTAVAWDQTAGTVGQLRSTAYTATGAFSLNTLSGSIILQSTAPSTPTITDISTQADGIVLITWTPPISSGGVPLLQYDISAAPFIGTTTVSGDVSSAIITGLNPATLYTATVTAYNTSGLTATSATSLQFKPNVAPTLVAGTYSIGSILEDVSDSSNVGITVATILLDLSCSADSSGIAIVSVVNISGVWQYNVGAGFTAVPDVSDASGLTLGATALVRFVPAANYFGTAALKLKVWDATTGSSGQFINTVYSASGAYSAAAATAALTIIAVNDSPQILNNPAITISTRAFGTTDFSGILVADMITALGANYFDVDPGSSKNIAVYEYAHFGTSQLQYNLGAGWLDVSSAIIRTNALLLGSTARVRVAAPSAAGTYDFNAVAWDATTGSSGQYVDASYVANGPFSLDHFTAATIITAIAPSAPTITAVTVPAEGTATVFWTAPVSTGGSPVSQYILETVPASSQHTLSPSTTNQTITGLNLSITYAAKLTVVTAADLSAVTISGSFRANFAPLLTAATYSLESIPVTLTDISNAGTPISVFLQTVSANTNGSGVAIVGAPAGWQYRLSGDVSFSNIIGASATAGLLLNGGARIRYSPLTVGTYTFNFKAWDQTEGIVGSYYDTVYSSVGAFSSTTASGELTVFAVNSAPSLTAAVYSLGTIPEDISAALNVGRTIATLIETISGNYVDDGVQKGLAIVGADNTNGQWQYKLVAGSFTNLTGLTASAALLLDASATVRFVPAANFNGTAQLSIKAWDQTVGTVGDIIDTSYTSAGAFSQNTGFAQIVVEAVNDPPVLVAGTYSLGGMIEDMTDASNVGVSVQTLISTISGNYIDIDGAARGIAIIGTDSAFGTWQYRLATGFFDAIEPVAATSGLLLDASAVVRFVPAANYNGFTTFQFKAWDQTASFAGIKTNTTYTASGAFSDVSAVASLYVSPTNDSPQINNMPMLTLETVSFTVTDASNSGITVQSIIDGLGTNYVDIDTGADRGIGIIGYTGIGGELQYSISGDGSWITAGGLTVNAALLLQPQSRIRVRNMSAAGQFTVTGIAWDRTTGSAGSIVDASYVEGGPYSFGTFMGIITVVAVAPDAAIILSAVATADNFELITWTAPIFTGGAAITRYELITNPYTVRTIAPGNATSAIINNMSAAQTYTATVIAVNAADLSAASLPSSVFRPNLPPILTAGTYSIGTILEDVSDASNVGVTIQSILIDLSCSVDSSSIVIVGLSNENGEWQYNAGSGFTAVPAVTDPSGFLLDLAARIRFVPALNYIRTATITVKVWDGTNGTVNTVVNTTYTTNGPYSADSAIAEITVLSQNDAPEIINNPIISLGDIPYLNATAINVSSLITLLGFNYIDNDIDASRNIAVYSYDRFGSSVIQFSADNGGTYTDVSSAISRSNALLLMGDINTSIVRWDNLSMLGTYTTNALAWDGTVGTSYTYADATYVLNGAFSQSHFSITFNVTAIPPQPPIITDISIAIDGAATIIWSAPTNTGGSPIKRYEIDTVPATSTFIINPIDTSYTLFGLNPSVEYYVLLTIITEADLSSNVSSSLFKPNIAPTLVTATYSIGSIPKDISNAANVGTTVGVFLLGAGAATNATGIAIIGVNNTNGTWQYSVGGPFANITGVSASAGLLLDASGMLRFVPALGYTGTATFTFKGWDQTVGTVGTQVNTAYSYTGAFSANTGTGQITVLPTNTSPAIINNPVIIVESIYADIIEADNGGVTIQSIIDALGPNYVETDPGALQGISIVGLSADNSGIIQYNIGAGWLSVGAVSLSTSLPLAPASSIRILPTSAGSGAFIAVAWDQTTGTAGIPANATYVPGGAYSFNGFRGIFNISAGTVILVVEPVSFSNEKTEEQLTEDRINRLLAVEAGVRLSEIPPNRQLYNSSDRLRVYLGRIRLGALALASPN